MSYSCSTCQPPDKADDHPKLHYGPDHYHYDCLPGRVKADCLGDQSTVQQQRLAQIIKAAESGTHGAKLIARVVAIHTEKDGTV